MKKNCYGKICFGIFIFMLISSAVYAQWPDNPDSNMMICDRTGDQTIPKIAATSDGGCYVCWFDLSSGNYDVYMQRLNSEGQIQWAPGGMLMSNQVQDTWLTDYDMTVDNNDHEWVHQ